MKTNNIFKMIGFAAGVCTALVAIGVIKKKYDDEKRREAEIEAEITEIIERKLSELESECSGEDE